MAGGGVLRQPGSGHAPVGAATRDVGRRRREPTTDYMDAGDRVVVRWRWWGQAHDGPDWTLEITGVYTVRMGRFFIMEFFFDHDDALEAAGLRE
jgi:hypothetical protein